VSNRQTPHRRDTYRHFHPITTRWMDNDTYGHVNNVVYYRWFDTVVNAYLVHKGVLDIEASPVIGLVVETHCNYFSPLAFPQTIVAALHVGHIGSASARYEIGLFAEDAETASAQGHFVHVYVDRNSRRAVPISASLRAVLEQIQAS
jgi:acyl-CoA thioester hydrolase